MTIKELEKVLYFESYLVIHPGETGLKEKQLLNEEEYREAREKYGNQFEAGMGAEAIKKLLEKIDIDKESEKLRRAMKKDTSQQKKLHNAKRLRVFKGLKNQATGPNG